mgnify:CR=1 FL=1
MNWVESAILLAHVLISLALVVLILLQRGKGADAGAAFGGGSSQTVFGGSGGVGFMVKLTAVLAALFFVTSFTLAMYAKQRAEVGFQAGVPSVEESAPQEESAEQGAAGSESNNGAQGKQGDSQSDPQNSGEEIPSIE